MRVNSTPNEVVRNPSGGREDYRSKGKSHEVMGYNIKMFGTRIVDIDERVVLSSSLTKLMKECGMMLIKEDKLDANNFMT